MVKKPLFIYLKPIYSNLKSRLQKKVEENSVEYLLKKHTVDKVEAILKKQFTKNTPRTIENLAFFYLLKGDLTKTNNILEKNNLRTSPIYIKAAILEGRTISPIIDIFSDKISKLSKKNARLLSKAVKNNTEKEKLKILLLKEAEIEQETSVWRLRYIGEASRRAGDYEEALKAYRKAFSLNYIDFKDILNDKYRSNNNTIQALGFNEDDAWIALNDFKSLAIPGWIIDAGTLLGFIREGSFMKHDYDLDLGFTDQIAYEKTREALFYSPLFELKPGRVKEVYKVRHINGMDIDIFLYQHTEDKMFKESHVYRWEFPKFAPVTKIFNNVSLPVPQNPERHLEATYGDWQTPQKDFDGRYDAFNASFPNIDELECVLLNKATLALQRGAKKSAQKEIIMLERINRKPPICD